MAKTQEFLNLFGGAITYNRTSKISWELTKLQQLFLILASPDVIFPVTRLMILMFL